MTDTGGIDRTRLFAMNDGNFESMALSLFKYQFEHNIVFRRYCDLVKRNPENVLNITDIPFLPISFFKNKDVISTQFEAEVVFESSKTTGSTASRHLVKDKSIYEESFFKSFSLIYGDVRKYCIIGLLPSYFERGNSSLVYMVDDLIKRSENKSSGFYLHDFEALYKLLRQNEEKQQPTLLFGVTFALLDFGSAYPLPLHNTIIIETGGMKGRKKEMTRDEVHAELKSYFFTTAIHSEYGMTELLSQAYAIDNGLFKCPPWMRMLVRDSDDPFIVRSNEKNLRPINGLGNIIDLANVHSCAFIATDDVVKLHSDKTFEVLGRSDNSDIRGCSLMVNVV